MRGFHSFLVIKSDVKITGALPLIHCTPNNDIVYEKMIVYEVCSFGCGMTSPYLAAVILTVTDECIKKLACIGEAEPNSSVDFFVRFDIS